MIKLFLSIALACGFILSTELNILTYNIHALSPLIAGDNPRLRINEIADIVDSYDIIFFQENWIFRSEELEIKFPGYNIVSSEKSKLLDISLLLKLTSAFKSA